MKFNLIKRVALIYGITFGCALFSAANDGDVYFKNNTDMDGSWVRGSRSNIAVSWVDNGVRKSLIVPPGPNQYIGPKNKITDLQYQNHGKAAGALQSVGLGRVYAVSDAELRAQPDKDAIVMVYDSVTGTAFGYQIVNVAHDRARKGLQTTSTFRDAGDLFPRVKAARDERSGQWRDYTLERYVKEKPHFFLNLPENATEAQILEQYKQLALKYHPDKNQPIKELATQAFKLLQTARDNMIKARKWQQ